MGVYIRTIFVVIAVLAFNYLMIIYPLASADTSILEIFFSLFGVLYAIIVGFAIYVVLENYNQIKQCMGKEVNELQDLRDYLIYVDDQDQVKEKIVNNINSYVQSVVDKEWPAMIACQSIDSDTPAEIYAIAQNINTIKTNNPSDSIALERLINSLAAVTTYRTERLVASIEKLPALLSHVIFMLSLFIVFVFTLIPINEFWLNMGLNALNSFGIALVYFVIMDLDYPFGGVWSIRPKPYEEFLKKISHN